MNKTASHSNTPTFVKNESNTKPVLYQHPTEAEMRTPFSARAKAVIKEFPAVALIVASTVFTTLTVRSCSDDVNRQHAQAVKNQLQFSTSNVGARK